MVKAVGFLLCLLVLSSPAFSQNTKGDRPLGNQRQVRETKGKSIKRKERGSTKDIAGRRLRTKGRSSANRANAGYRQPSTSRRNVSKDAERAAPPRGRTFTRSPRETKVRAWKGDVSGHPIRRIKPGRSDAARTNVYPQKGPYVRYARKRPKEKPPVYSRTIKGVPFVKHRPRTEERAWKGGVDKGPIKNQSATGSTRNTYSQNGPYISSYLKRAKRQSKSYSNRSEIAKAKRYSRPPRTSGGNVNVFPSSGSRPYVQRGRKNVYWGKYQKKERGVTTDITGGPLRTRNYRSATAGLVGRDSLKFFGRKPGGDRSPRVSGGGYPTATKRGGRSWKGDVAGWPVRSPRKQQARSNKPLKPTEPGIGAEWLAKIFSRNFRGVRPKDLVPDMRELKYQGNIPREGATKSFGDQGTGYAGNIKRGRRGFEVGGVGYSGNQKRGAKGFERGGAGYAGNMKRGSGFDMGYAGYSGSIKQRKGFSQKWSGYSGTIKRSQERGFSKAGANYSGNIRQGKGFDMGYAGYSGNLKQGRKGFSSEYIGYSGDIEYVGRIKQFGENGVGYRGFMKRSERGFGEQGESFRGNIKRSSIAGFSEEGAGFSGWTKAKRPAKGGGSVSGILWNNKESAVAGNPQGSADAAYFSGRTKARKPAKGGGSVSGVLWNNNESAIASNPQGSPDAAYFSGRTKARRPLKGGGSVSGVLWNNNESALAKNPPLNNEAGGFSGRTKAKRPLKGGGSVSGVLWNNNESALSKSPPENAGAPGGLQVRVKQADYARKPNANKNALPGIAPTKASVKASEYSRTMKMYWNYKHNPSASRYALKTIAPGKAEARIRDYQGNVKMRKNSISGLHPDAQFAHSEEDNVKEERSFFTNVKVLWAKMFHKNGVQPSSVKDKGKKLQYDKREKGLWAY